MKPRRPPLVADCYSAGDRKLMVLSQRIRGWLLTPFLVLLQRCRITANGLTLISLVVGLAFGPMLFVNRPLALALLLLHVALDGLDGPLARHTGTASPRGSFSDTVVDQIVVAATTTALIIYGTVHILPGVLYLFTYTLVIAFSLARNALATPYTWLVRPRLFVYAMIPLALYWKAGFLDYALWGFAGVLAIKGISGFVMVRRGMG